MKTLNKSFVGVRGAVFQKSPLAAGGKKLLKTGIVLLLSFFFIFAQQKKWDALTHDKTNFPLIGKHRTVACSECHLKGVMQGTPTDCEACHWYRKQDDRYRLQLGSHCADCHTPFDWKKTKPGAWDHGRDTGYTLTGSHKFVDCFQCHQGKAFAAQTGECFDCHKKDYNNAPDPDHAQSQFPTECEMCHNKLTWEGAKFNHTYFPLKGMHQTASCVDCHKNGLYIGLPSECMDCHLDDYNRTTDPNHKQAGYSTDCEKCHGNNALSWQGATFNHDSFWAIRGAHKGLDCSDCHAQGYNISGKCVSCHLNDYNNAKDPDHRKAGFSTDCEICHLRAATSWNQAGFDHQFPIFSGKHAHLACSDCHTTANYYEFSCIDCHEHSKSEMDNEHKGVGGYSYNSQACYTCHPSGRE